MNFQSLKDALTAGHYETARRIGYHLLENAPTERAEVLLLTHDALVKLADFKQARALLEENANHLSEHRFDSALRLAEDLRTLAHEGHYRLSDEAKQGYTLDEYLDKYRQLSTEMFEQAQALAQNDQARTQIQDFQAGRVRAPFDQPAQLKVEDFPANQHGQLTGRILLEDGKPVAHATVTLGLKVTIESPDPASFTTNAMHFAPRIGPLRKLTVVTDEDGLFKFDAVPAGTHEFLAVTMDPLEWALPTRFLARAVTIEADEHTDLNTLTVSEWQSAPAATTTSPHPESFYEDGNEWKKCEEWNLNNPFYFDFPLQLLKLAPANSCTDAIRVRIGSNEDVPFQINSAGEICLLAELAARSQQTIAVYQSTKSDFKAPSPEIPIRIQSSDTEHGVIETGVASFRIANESCPPATPPLLAVKGVDQVWRGQGRFVLPEAVEIEQRTTSILEQGELLVTIEHSYHLSDGSRYSLQMTAIAGQPLLLVDETTSGLAGAAFEFSLQEFSGGRGFLHWSPENGSRHWTTLGKKDESFAQLQESIAWWIPPNGFACAMTAEGLESKDYIGVFSRRRGEWDDKLFATYAQGPIDAAGNENRELEWPHPEMIGSTISMISAKTSATGDAFYHFNFFEGSRKWGLLVSSFDLNDGANKQLGHIQHAYSSPRLQEFKDWHFDVQDHVERPHLITKRADLIQLRKKSRSGPFAGLWNKIRSEPGHGPTDGVVFAIDADPLVAWKKCIILREEAKIRSKMTLLGRDWSDMYSPVGGRSITQAVEEYDLLAPSGVFSPEEERMIRAHFILMAHMFMEEDFMNWRYNGRNANFEADRVDIVGAIGLTFRGHPDASKFTDHVLEQNESALLAYCTPGSGRWYENPACYYLHASRCRINLIFHLARQGLVNINEIPRLKDFLRWGMNLLTPAHPVDYQVMHKGDAASYAADDKIRKVPPIGDHAGIGRWLSEHYAFMGKLYLETDPEFGQELINTYCCSNADGMRLLGKGSWEKNGPETSPQQKFTSAQFGNLPLLFCNFHEEDLPQSPQVTPPSRRLEGFGSVFRNKVNEDHESYLLINQGPGGYRYHRTEGSFIYFAKGVPLVFDGGEAGETWRHSTLSFHDVHMPLSAGRVERHFDANGLQFCQGVHPVILQPGDAIYLNDSCHHSLVEECYRRYNMEQPAAVRSFSWIDDDYLIIHDDLHASQPELSHWHLQVVGQAPKKTGEHSYHFTGRFGVDLQVILPDQSFTKESCAPLPVSYYEGQPEDWFTMQHLQLTSPNASGYLAALKPVTSGQEVEFQCQALKQNEQIIGAAVTQGTSQDLLWFYRDGLLWENKHIAFEGRFGAYLQRSDSTRYALMGAGKLSSSNIVISSDGPAALLTTTEESTTLQATGNGCVSIRSGVEEQSFQVSSDSPVEIALDLKMASILPA